MSCDEIEALRLALMNVLGVDDREARRHAEEELGDALDEGGVVAALAEAEDLDEVRRHLDSCVVELEREVSGGDPSPYHRGRLVAVRQAERAVERLALQGGSLLDDLGDTHTLLHETFPDDE